MRKRPAAFVFLACLATLPARAQDVDFGVKAGVNLAELKGGGLIGDVIDELGTRTGLAGGVFLRLPLGSAVSLQPEALYSQKGAEVDLPLGEVAIELDYLDLALPLRVDLLPDSPVRPFLLGGPYAGFNLRARVVARLVVDVADEDLDEIVRDTEFGLLAGAGLRFAAGGVNLDVEARYSRGLTSIEDVPEGEEVRNQVLSFLAGVSF